MKILHPFGERIAMKEERKKIEQIENARSMNLAAWRKSRLHELDLPSGLRATLRDVTMTDLMLTGSLTDSFVDLAQDAAQKDAATLDLKAITKNAAEFRKMLDALVTLSLVEPKLGAVADDEHITLDEMPNDDKMAIFNFVNREVTALQSFREGQAEPVAAV